MNPTTDLVPVAAESAIQTKSACSETHPRASHPAEPVIETAHTLLENKAKKLGSQELMHLQTNLDHGNHLHRHIDAHDIGNFKDCRCFIFASILG